LSFLSLLNLRWVRKVIRWLNAILLKSTSPFSLPLLLVSVDFPPHTDGVSTIAKELSTRIAQRGRQVLVIGPQGVGACDFDALQSYRCFRVPGYEWGYWRFMPVLISMPWVIFRHRVRKIFAMNIAYGGVLSWLLSFFLPLEYLIFAYGYEFEKVKHAFFLHGLYLKIYRRAKGIVCCSELVRQRLIRFGAPAAKIKVLYPAVDFSRYYPCQVPDHFLTEKNLSGYRIILTVGRLIERKGHDQVLKALPQIIERFPNILYGIVGIGPHEPELRRQVRALGIEKHVRFMGRVSDQDLLFLYNACEVFVMPSREIVEGGHLEGFGIVYLEANACGKPVIGGNSGGVLEAVQDGVTGLLVNPCSPEDIAEKIIEMLADPKKAQDLGNRGLQRVRETFDWNRYVEDAYHFLCGETLP
jgi:phosphatidylinositol alpha-1,6-mannosyltransferase